MAPDEMASSTIRMLLIEDGLTDAGFVRSGLESEGTALLGFRITHIVGTEQAVAALESGEGFDVVLLESGLPGNNGSEGLKAVLGAASDMPVVVICGGDDRRFGLEAIRLGAEDYLLRESATTTLLTQVIGNAIERMKRRSMSDGEIRRAYEFFRSAIESIGDGIALYDRDERLVTANSDFRNPYPHLRDLFVPGKRYEEMIRANAYSGTVAAAVGREEAYVVERLETHRRPTGPVERQLPNGRWLLVSDRRFDGGSGIVVTDITALKAQEEELKRTAAVLEATFENMVQGIVVFDGNLRLAACNRRYVELLDLPEAFAAKGTPTERILRYRAERGDFGPGDMEDLVRDRLDRLRRGERQNHDSTIHDGRVVSVIGQPAEGGNHVLTFTDVTEQRRLEQEAREAQQKLVDALEDSPEGYLVFDADERLIYFNDRWAEMFPGAVAIAEGYPTYEELVREGFRTLFSLPDEEAEYDRHVARRLAQRDNPESEELLALPDDRWVQVRQRRMRDGGIVTAFLDITGQKISERQLRESEERFRAFAETASDYFAVLDEDLRYSFMGERFFEVTGLTTEQVLGKRRGELPDAVVIVESGLAENKKAMEERRPFREFVYSLRQPDGQLRHVRSSGRPFFDANGNFRGYYTTGSDITELKKLESQLQQAQKMEAVGQLTGGVAHDFNNLLTVVMGNLQLLERRMRGDERQQKHVRMALDAAQRGGELTKRLLAFSRRQVLAPKIADLNALVDGMAMLLRRTLGETIAFNIKPEHDLWKTCVDVSQFESALLNLAVNARDAMPDGGALLVETNNRWIDELYAAGIPELEPGPYVVVSVSDTGTGIPAEIVDRVFEPFFTTKEVGKGTGLGLSMIYGFVKQSQGHVTIYSEAGQGTTIRLYFPRAGAGDEVAAGREVEAIATGGSETILVVEDEQAVRETLALILEDYGYTVIAAADGPSALETLREAIRVDLLLTDVVMPGGMNGREVAEQARVLRPELKVLLTSGYPRETITRNGVLNEGVAFIGKPYDHDDLARKIRELLDA